MANGEDSVVYVLVLKWKQGEHGAVKPLSAAQRALMLPIAEMQDRTYDWNLGLYKKTWEEHLDKMAGTTKNAWGKSHEIAVDMNAEPKNPQQGPAAQSFQSKTDGRVSRLML